MLFSPLTLYSPMANKMLPSLASSLDLKYCVVMVVNG